MRGRGSRRGSTPNRGVNAYKRRTLSKSTPEKSNSKIKKLKRVRISTSPESECSSSHDSEAPSVVPPAEYYPFEYRVGSVLERCPRFTKLLDIDPEDVEIRLEDLIRVQHELEKMLSHAADFMRQLHGETRFLSTGEYPTTDLRKRPRPIYAMRNRLDVSQTEDSDVEMDAPIVPPEPEDNIDAWPPISIPQRFWTWCKHNFLKPINTELMEQFQSHFIDPYSKEGVVEYMVNEPWKHRIRRKPSRSRNNSMKKRKSKGEKNCTIKPEIDFKEVANFDHIELTSSPVHSIKNSDYYVDEISRMPIFDTVPYQLLKEMVDAYFAEKDQEQKQCNRNGNALGIDISLCDSVKSESQLSPMEIDEQDEEYVDANDTWDAEDHKENLILEPCTITMENFETVATPVTHELDEETIESVGECAIKSILTFEKTNPEFLEEFRRRNLEAVPHGVSDEGRIPGEPMDDVSVELLKLQRQLQSELIEYNEIAEEIHVVLKNEYAANMLKIQLNNADEELIRLGGKCFREPPLPRRIANDTDMAVLKRAKAARNKKAKAYYREKYVEAVWDGVKLKAPTIIRESKLPWPIEEIRRVY